MECLGGCGLLLQLQSGHGVGRGRSGMYLVGELPLLLEEIGLRKQRWTPPRLEPQDNGDP